MTKVSKQKALVAIRRIMKDNLFRRQVISKQGRLCMNRLHAYQTSSHLFIKPQEKEGKAYHVELLIDNSGSMYNYDRAEPAFEAAKKIANVLGAYCDLKITSFDYLEKKFCRKEFAKMDFNDDYCIEGGGGYNYSSVVNIDGENHVMPGDEDNTAGGNWEVANVVNAASRLRKKEGTRIIIILLDGNMRTDCWHEEEMIDDNMFFSGLPVRRYNSSTYVNDVKKIEKEGIKVKAFGIGTSDPKQYFSDFTQIDDPEDIYGELIKFLTAATK